VRTDGSIAAAVIAATSVIRPMPIVITVVVIIVPVAMIHTRPRIGSTMIDRSMMGPPIIPVIMAPSQEEYGTRADRAE
jgi:hypothetical protein